LSSYVASHRLAVAPQSGAKQKNCTVYYITLNSNCDTQRASKNLIKKLYKIELEAKINAQVIRVYFFYFLKEKIMFKSQ
jgi:hypothetical protein